MLQIGSVHFNWIDLIVVIFIVRGVYRGYKRGLSGEVLRFLGILIALYLSFKFYEPLAERIVERFSLEHNVAIALSFAGIALAVIIFFYLVNRMVRSMMELPIIAAIERAGGAILGGVKTLLFVCAFLIILALVRIEAISNAVSRDSLFGSYAIAAVPGVYRLVVRVYPEAKSLPAEEVIDKLPAVQAERSGEPDFIGKEKRGSEREDTDYIKPDYEE